MMASKASLVFQRLANTLLERHHQHEPKWTDQTTSSGATSPDPITSANNTIHDLSMAMPMVMAPTTTAVVASGAI
jgi:hypothetical protein